jgi:DNA topoisomerase-1
VALRVLVERERERMLFKKATYWDISAGLQKEKITFKARLVNYKDKKVATGKDFDEKTGKLLVGKDVRLLGQSDAEALAQKLKGADWKVESVEEKEMTARPLPPFITSTLQQEGNRKLNLSSRDTMRAAQSLYEKGFITYMRTDSVTLSEEAVKGIRDMVKNRYGAEFLTDAPKQFANKDDAQQAHEAVRPSLTFTPPQDTGLTGNERDVYELIWMRAIASQMRDAKQVQQTVTLKAANHQFSASGTKIIFPGFLRAYVEGADDVEQALEEKERVLPELRIGDKPSCNSTSFLI